MKLLGPLSLGCFWLKDGGGQWDVDHYRASTGFPFSTSFFPPDLEDLCIWEESKQQVRGDLYGTLPQPALLTACVWLS